MITRYTDLAANERTYLAWMRTALALIAFGFLLERFDLLVRYFAKSLVQEKIPIISPFGREAGIVLAILGLIIMVISSIRFTVTTKRIRSESQEIYSFKSVLLTGGVFIALALFVLVYVSRMLQE
jgi:putative membrane protein